VVTGASRGIGRATALALARRGIELALVGRASRALDESAAACAARVPVKVIDCDLRAPEQIAGASVKILAIGAPAALVNVAGVIRRGNVETLPHSAYDEQLDVNLRAPFLLTAALLPAMRAKKHGRIVHVGSISSTLGTSGAAAYAASKWGLIGFMKSLAEELHDTGLMTVAVLPGSVDTEMLAGSGFPPRMSAEEVAATLVHYALDAPLAHNGGVIEMLGT
jgi:3-oxoacyl-[acyl-carrier protein] reductase